MSSRRRVCAGSTPGRVRGGHLHALAHPVEDLASGDESFGLWLHIVDRRMLRTVGLTHTDLPDQPWRDEYDAGTDPVDYADHVMRAELT